MSLFFIDYRLALLHLQHGSLYINGSDISQLTERRF